MSAGRLYCDIHTTLWDYKANHATYSGLLFSEKKLSSIAAWLKDWHSRWVSKFTKLSHDLQQLKHTLSLTGIGGIDEELIHGIAILVGLVVGIKYFINDKSISGAIGWFFGGIVAIWICGFTASGIIVLIKKQNKDDLQKEVDALEKQIALVYQEHP